MALSLLEVENGRLAARVVFAAGGSVSFKEYDHLTKDEKYFVPLGWIWGWALARAHDFSDNGWMDRFRCGGGIARR